MELKGPKLQLGALGRVHWGFKAKKCKIFETLLSKRIRGFTNAGTGAAVTRGPWRGG